jgi:hypothetical protein
MHRASLRVLPGVRRPRSRHQTPSVGDLVERPFARTESTGSLEADLVHQSAERLNEEIRRGTDVVGSSCVILFPEFHRDGGSGREDPARVKGDSRIFLSSRCSDFGWAGPSPLRVCGAGGGRGHPPSSPDPDA